MRVTKYWALPALVGAWIALATAAAPGQPPRGGAAPPSRPDQPPPPAATAPLLLEVPTASSDGRDATPLDHVITQLILESVPHTYTDDKDWGGQSQRFDGLEWRREGWKLETKRRWKMVNDGTWRRVTVSLVKPDETLTVQLREMRLLDDGRVGFEVAGRADMTWQARQSQWVKGTQLYSLSGEGTATVELVVSGVVVVARDDSAARPTLTFTPTVESADLELIEFRVDRVSKLGGEFAQQVTRLARGALEDKIADRESRLVTKLNGALARHADELRIELDDVIGHDWTRRVWDHLPPSWHVLID